MNLKNYLEIIKKIKIKFLLSIIFIFTVVFFKVNFLLSSEITLEDLQKYTMQDLINLAVENNPTLQAAKIQQQALTYKIQEVLAQKKFKLSWENKITYVGNVTKLQPVVIPMIPPTPDIVIPGQNLSSADIYDINFSLQKPLYTGKKIETLGEESKLNQKRSVFEYQKYLNDIAYSIKEAYFNLLYLKKIVEVQQSAKDAAKEHLKVAQAKEKAGISPHLEVIRADVEVKSEESKLLSSNNSLDLAYIALEKLLGVDLTKEQIDLLAESIENKRVDDFKKYEKYYQMSLEDIQKFAYENRPELALMNIGLNLAMQDINLAKSEKKPTLSFAANYSLNKGDQIPAKFRERWNLNLIFSYLILDSGKAKHSQEFALANKEVALKKIEEIKLNVDLEINQAYLQIKDATSRLDLAKASVDEAKENFRLSSLRYGQGLGTNVDVIDARLLLVTQTTNLYKAVFDLEIARAKLLQTVGIAY